MRKRKQKKNSVHLVECNNNLISQENMIEIHAEAYYRALKRIENEKLKGGEKKLAKKKHTWYENVFFVLNVLFWPWKINKKFVINNRVYESVLVMFVSNILDVIGFFLWMIGILELLCVIYQILTIGITVKLLGVCGIIFFSLLFGSAFVLAGKEFEKETDSNTIYAYSASIIALISCVVGIIALIKMF